MDRVILETVNGGYFLNGNFHYGTGTAAGGYMEDLDAIAMSMFSANGQLSLSQAKVFASSWRASAKGMSGFSGRKASTQELIDNLAVLPRKATRRLCGRVSPSPAAAAAQVVWHKHGAVQQRRTMKSPPRKSYSY